MAWSGYALLVLSGTLFGLATAFRSNGILAGLLFALDFVEVGTRLLLAWTGNGDAEGGRVKDAKANKAGKTPRVAAPHTPSAFESLATLLALGVGGCLVGVGSAVPQLLAYQRYCPAPGSSGASILGRRPWCDEWVPSIYTFVQSHYWSVPSPNTRAAVARLPLCTPQRSRFC